MKKTIILLITVIALFAPKTINSQILDDSIIQKYLKFVFIEQKSVVYETTIEYDNGNKIFVRLANKITSYDVNIPEFGINLNSPQVLGLRLENGVIWIGSMITSFKHVNSIDIHKETWYDSNGNVLSENIFSESPTTLSEITLQSNLDNEEKELIEAIVKFVKSKNE